MVQVIHSKNIEEIGKTAFAYGALLTDFPVGAIVKTSGWNVFYGRKHLKN